MDILSNSQVNYWVSFFYPNISGGVINSIIFFLLLLTYSVSRSTKKRYKKKERMALKKMREKVDEKFSTLKFSIKKGDKEIDTSNPGKEIEGNRNKIPDLLMDIDFLREGVDKKSIIYKRLDAIERMRKLWVKIDTNFLQQITLTEEASKSGVTLPKYATNLAMILGLFGTFVGLAIMVSKINMLMPKANSVNFSMSTLMASMSGMETIFGGMSTAFSTSILGLITTIVCLTLNYRIQRYQSAFFHELESFTVEKLIPVTVPRIESEHLLEEVSLQIQDSFNSLNQSISQNNDTLINLNAIENSFKTIVDQVRDITRREESRSFENVLGLISDTNKSLTKIIEQLPEMASALENRSQLAEKKIELLISEMKKQQEILMNGMKNQQEILINSINNQQEILNSALNRTMGAKSVVLGEMNSPMIKWVSIVSIVIIIGTIFLKACQWTI